MGVPYRVEVAFMNACVCVWLVFFAVRDAKTLFCLARNVCMAALVNIYRCVEESTVSYEYG